MPNNYEIRTNIIEYLYVKKTRKASGFLKSALYKNRFPSFINKLEPNATDRFWALSYV